MKNTLTAVRIVLTTLMFPSLKVKVEAMSSILTAVKLFFTTLTARGENRTHDLDVASVKVKVMSLILTAVKVFFTFLVETHPFESTY